MKLSFRTERSGVKNLENTNVDVLEILRFVLNNIKKTIKK